MGEILFKARRLDNGEWEFGYYVKLGGRHYIVPRYASALYVIEVDEETVCQSTRRVDNHGMNVFDGDLVKLITGRVCQVKFRNTPEYCGFDLVPYSNTDNPAPRFGVYEGLEIVGNIYGGVAK